MYRNAEDKNYEFLSSERRFLFNLLFDAGYNPVRLDDYGLLVKIRINNHVLYITDRDFNCGTVSTLLDDKCLTYLALSDIGVSIPEGFYIIIENSVDNKILKRVLSYLSVMNTPIVIKPNNSSQSNGYTVLNQFNEYEVYKALYNASELSNMILCQEFVRGAEYRVFSIRGKILYIVKRFEYPVLPMEIKEPYDINLIYLIDKVMKNMSISVAGFDVIQKKCGEWVVIEINSKPFLEIYRKYLSV